MKFELSRTSPVLLCLYALVNDPAVLAGSSQSSAAQSLFPPCRGTIVAANTIKGAVSADMEINTIHDDLLIVTLARSVGSHSGFHSLFNFITAHESCAEIIHGNVIRAPSTVTSPRSQLSSPSSPLSPLQAPSMIEMGTFQV